MNLEYASNTLEELGLRQKLIAIKNNPHAEGSLAWWLNKEPLRSKPLGTEGKTAKELGLDVVAHETNDFLAFESITRAHTGEPNVLISRKNSIGEKAVNGDGFYTVKGTRGARGTGITIRFKVDPNAREGEDFTRAENHVIWHNRSAIQVIPESLEMSPSQYFEFLADGKEISKDDQALMWKLRRKFDNAISSGLTTPEEIKKTRLLVLEQMKSNGPNRDLILNEWIRLEAPRVGIKPDLVAEARATYRADPAPFMDVLRRITRGTELQNWMDQEGIPHFMTGLKPDVGEGAMQRALLSHDPAVKEFGLRALAYREKERPSALTRALRKIANHPDTSLESFLKSEEPADEKAAIVLTQTGPHANPPDHFQNMLKLVPEGERPAVEQSLAKNTNFPLFEKLATNSREEGAMLNSTAPESFQFIAFSFPKDGTTFEMGSPGEGGRRFIETPHPVILTKPFEIQATPVTQAQWELVMKGNPSKFKNSADSLNRPVEQVEWEDILRFIQKLNELDPRYVYRLPTEAEYEFATRAGTRTTYSFGDDASSLSDYAWHAGNSGGQTHPVAVLKPNPAGLYDVHGNVSEWVQDRWDSDPQQNPLAKDPTGPASGDYRTIRGAGFSAVGPFLRSGQRAAAKFGSESDGFRLARTPRIP